MAGLSAEQRHDYYLREAIRTAVHKPLLAALHDLHRSPQLSDGETGLGISPANRIPFHQVDTFPKQVEVAASTLRSLTDKLMVQGWTGADIWQVELGRYSDRFIQTVANGYMPIATDLQAARLEAIDSEALLQRYQECLAADLQAIGIPAIGPSTRFDFVDGALLRFGAQLPRYYMGLGYQRQALLEAVRLWRQLDTRQATIASLQPSGEAAVPEPLDEVEVDQPLLNALQPMLSSYAGYPHQREAWLRLVQLWQQIDSREQAIAFLQVQAAPTLTLQLLDPVLVAFSQRIVSSYQGQGEQRNALTEAFRLWRGLDNRTYALKELGVDPHLLTASHPNRQALVNAAAQVDRALLDFMKRVPGLYQETEPQREALLRLVQVWRGLDRDQAIESLLDDLRRLERSRPGTPDAAPRPEPIPLPPRPHRWTPDNLQLYAPIVASGDLTWAEATHGGTQRPTSQVAVDAIVRMADLAQQVQHALGRPLRIVNWYACAIDPPNSVAVSRHHIGDAIDFYCDGLTGDQLYRALDPWWRGGLGRYRDYPELCHIDDRGDRARWRA